MKKTLLVLLVSVFCFENSFGQKQNNIWYFGDNAGVDFASGSPVALSNGQTNTLEGTSTISDANGNLLFYTDGVTVWDNTHNAMLNGFGLSGSFSSTQSALIIPQPGSSVLYIIFTTAALGGASGCCYSVVDMSMNAGLGDVTIKNVQLHTPTTEKLAACRNSNGTDYWVITHEVNADVYLVYPVTSSGVGAPVASTTGATHTGNSCFGQMTYSCPNNKVATIVRNSNTIDLLDFDPSTGVLSNPISITNVTGTLYGLCFSPNGFLLYVCDYNSGTLFQFDISSGIAATINSSAVIVGTTSGGFLGSMQLAVDNKIYIADYNTSSIAVINNPDMPGIACSFTDQAIPLSGNVNFGLQNFPVCAYPTINLPVAIFNAPNNFCPGTCTDFTNLTTNATSFQWTFPGATPSSSIDVNPQNICYPTSGNYDVQLIATNANGSDTLLLANYITVYPSPPPQSISQSGDTLFAIAGSASYQWYFNGNIIPGATDYFYIAPASGDYNVVATDLNGCEVEAAMFNVIASLVETMAAEIFVFPNPVGEKLAISSQQWAINTVSIYNTLGELVLAVSLPTAHCPEISGPTCTFDVSQLPSGLYFIEVSIQEKTFRAKFVKSPGRTLAP